MFGRKNARDRAAEAATTVAQDEKLRRRLMEALGHAEQARRRALPRTGLIATASRIATDEEIQEHIREVRDQLRMAQKRVQRKQSHRLRNTMLLLLGGGVLAALFPRLREKASTPQAVSGLTTIEEETFVSVPVATAYNQWTQFEDFPLFMEGVDHVQQLDDTRLRWVASIGGKQAEWEAKIVEQVPDTRIVWESREGRETRGEVTFDKLGENRTRVRLSMAYRPQGPVERAGAVAGFDRRRIRGDLERFKDLVESRGTESGAWRGEIHSGATT